MVLMKKDDARRPFVRWLWIVVDGPKNATPVPLRWDWRRLMTRDRRDFGVVNVISIRGNFTLKPARVAKGGPERGL